MTAAPARPACGPDGADPDAGSHGTVLARLRAGSAPWWDAYVAHPFVAAIGDGSLHPGAFRRYLTQDWLFLIQFSRAYALAAYKSDTLEELRAAASTLQGLLETEMPLHRQYCAGWGIDAAAMDAEPEALETTAYTRFVLERGIAGDRLDLEVALAPCIHGYAEIGARLEAAGADAANPYAPWIATYAGPAYRAVARAASDNLDGLWRTRGGAAREASLQRVFTQATCLEAAFWDMGLRGQAGGEA